MRATVDPTYQQVVSRLPEHLRGPARTLLLALGLASTLDADWADVFRLEPSLELPLFTERADHPYEPALLNAFLEAHHCACFYSVLVDRMADRQADSTLEREQLAACFLEHWRHRLTQATGDPPVALADVARAVQALQKGIHMEQGAISHRSLDLNTYGQSILLKLAWAHTASECLLRNQQQQRRNLFRRAFQLLALALQVVDDAQDSAEDLAVRGTSFPVLLGFAPAALFSAGVLLTREAIFAAAQGGFERFAQWLSNRTHELERLRRKHVRPEDSLGGMVIFSSLEALCLSVATHTPGSTAGTISSASSM